jgi:hypothetical protein
VSAAGDTLAGADAGQFNLAIPDCPLSAVRLFFNRISDLLWLMARVM